MTSVINHKEIDKFFDIINKIKDINSKSHEILSQAYQDQEVNIIDFEQFAGIQNYERIDFDDTGENYGVCIYKSNDLIVLVLVQKENTDVNAHIHDFMERFVLIDGAVQHELDDKITLMSGDVLEIQPYTIHSGKVLQNSISIVHIIRKS